MMHVRLDAEEGRRPQHEIGELALLDRADQLRDAVRDRGVDGVFGDVALDAEIVVVALVLRSRPRCFFILSAVCQVRMMTSPSRPMAWQSDDIIESAPRSCRMSSAAMVSLRMRLSAKARSSAIDGIEMMAHHQHVEMLVDGVAGERPRRIGRGRQHVLQAGDLDDVRRVAAAGALGVEGVDGAALERRDGVLDEAEFVERVGMDHHLDVVIVGDRQAAVDRRRRRAPVLVQLERTGAGLDHLLERGRARGVALAGKAEIDRERVDRLDHPRHVPGAGRAGRGIGAVRRAGAAAEHRGDAAHQRVLDLLRADEMDVACRSRRR